MPFVFKEHTADVRVECRAPTFPALLETAADAFYAVAFCRRRDGGNAIRRARFEATSAEEMLVRWLQELIFLADVDGFVMTHADFEAASPNKVCAVLSGYIAPPADRETEVKAATYHGMAVRRDNDDLVAEIVFDL